MKKLILLFSLILSTAVFANRLQWSDLEMNSIYSLEQDVIFGNGLSFKAGKQFNMNNIISGEIPVIYIEMYDIGCTDYSATAEMILVNIPQENSRDIVIGAQLYEGCNLGLYIEPMDYYSLSVFKD